MIDRSLIGRDAWVDDAASNAFAVFTMEQTGIMFTSSQVVFVPVYLQRQQTQQTRSNDI